ncbi:MAG: hypothetical protein J5U17_09775 [Candidatus Methanoperedens sp.]|nr:hypothetical protein [Candidatus Methanoperedens sp.]
MNEYHLIKHFSKPEEGEYVPITFIEFKRKLVGWSPELKRSIYIENEEEKTKLKRIRETNVMFAINHMSGKTATIELTDEEKARFEKVYDSFIMKGGQLMYTRKKIGAKTISFFEIHEVEKRVDKVPEKSLLSERFGV